jgi:hypothetical protein
MTIFSPLPPKLNTGFFIFKGSTVWIYINDLNAKPEDPTAAVQIQAAREYCDKYRLKLENTFADVLKTKHYDNPRHDYFYFMAEAIKDKTTIRPEAILIYKPIIFSRADTGDILAKALKNRKIILHSITIEEKK